MRFISCIGAISYSYSDMVTRYVEIARGLSSPLAPIEKKLYSTLRCGEVSNVEYTDQQKAGLHLTRLRALYIIKRLIKNRRLRRSEAFTKLINERQDFKNFTA